MILLLSAEGDDTGLLAELARSGLVGRVVAPGLVAVDEAPAAADLARLRSTATVRGNPVFGVLALARQALPDATRLSAPSVGAWARVVVDRLTEQLVPGPWRLHVVAHYGLRQRGRMGARAWHSVGLRGAKKQVEAPTHQAATVAPGAGVHRRQLIEAAIRELLKERRRALIRTLSENPTPFREGEALVQLVLTSAEEGWLSIVPDAHALRPWISNFPAGEVEIAPDKAAPSRAFAKLREALVRLGRPLGAGEACVDLGASPGGWSFVALHQGARVIAVDRSELRADLMRHPRLQFVKADAFTWRPPTPVDWLLCDVIAAPERSIQVLLDWLRRGDTRWFVVTIKLRGPEDHATLDVLKAQLPELAHEWYLTHLCANKGEACVYGRAR